MCAQAVNKRSESERQGWRDRGMKEREGGLRDESRDAMSSNEVAVKMRRHCVVL